MPTPLAVGSWRAIGVGVENEAPPSDDVAWTTTGNAVAVGVPHRVDCPVGPDCDLDVLLDLTLELPGHEVLE